MDVYGGSFAVVCIAIAECIGLMWIYGLNKFCTDLEFMLGSRPGIYWQVTWSACAPILLAVSQNIAVQHHHAGRIRLKTLAACGRVERPSDSQGGKSRRSRLLSDTGSIHTLLG